MKLLPIFLSLAISLLFKPCEAQEDLSQRAHRFLKLAKEHQLNESFIKGDTLGMNYALYLACLDSTSSPELVTTLINQGANVHYEACSDPGLFKQFLFGFTKIILGTFVPGLGKAQLGQDCDDLLEITYNRRRNIPVAKLLAERGLYSEHIMKSALGDGYRELFEILFDQARKYDSWTFKDLISIAAHKGDAQMVARLIKDPRNSWSVDENLVIAMTKKGDLDILRVLLGSNYRHSTLFSLKSRTANVMEACAESNDLRTFYFWDSLNFRPNGGTLLYALQNKKNSGVVYYIAGIVDKEISMTDDVLESCSDPVIKEYLISKGALSNVDRFEAIQNGKAFFRQYMDSCTIGSDSYNRVKARALMAQYEGKKVIFEGREYDIFSSRTKVLKEVIDRNDIETLKWLLANTNVEIYGSSEWKLACGKFDNVIFWKRSGPMYDILTAMIDSEKDPAKQERIVGYCIRRTANYHRPRYWVVRRKLMKRYNVDKRKD